MRVRHNLKDSKATANYSESLIRGVILNQKLALESSDAKDTINFNSSCVFFAVSFLEAKINEIITSIVNSGFSNSGVPEEHWRMIKNIERKLTIEEKWNYVASAYDGTVWDNNLSIFADFEVIKALRNELIHYKGDELEIGKAPSKKITNLLKEPLKKTLKEFLLPV